MNNRILIGFPCSSRAWVLPYFLQHIYNINYDKKLIDIYCIVNNSNDNSESILREFNQKYKDEYNSITIEVYNNSKIPQDERMTHIREQTYHWLCELRNKILKRCVDINCDMLFSVDTDILVPSNILNELMIDERSVVASLIYNGYLYTPPNESKQSYNSILNSYKFPNILKFNDNKTSYTHIVNYHVKNPNLTQKDKLLQVDATGAVSLIPKDICAVSQYSWHTQGEDMSWSKTVQDAGYSLCCKPSVYSQHIMSQDLLHMYLNGELKFANGEVIQIN